MPVCLEDRNVKRICSMMVSLDDIRDVYTGYLQSLYDEIEAGNVADLDSWNNDINVLSAVLELSGEEFLKEFSKHDWLIDFIYDWYFGHDEFPSSSAAQLLVYFKVGDDYCVYAKQGFDPEAFAKATGISDMVSSNYSDFVLVATMKNKNFEEPWNRKINRR